MESCGMNVIKYILFLFNLIFAISGIGIIVAGAVVLADIGEFSHFMEGRILAPPIVLVVAGAIVFFIAFLGCYGAIKENYTMLMAFAVALLVIFIVELAVGIAAAVFKNDFSKVMRDTLDASLKSYNDGDKVAWDNVQTKLECCGVDGPENWRESPPYATGNLPLSCCKEMPTSGQCAYNTIDIHTKGCLAELEMRVQQGAKVLIGVGIGIAFVEVAGIVLACCLAAAIKREGDK